MSDHDRSLVAFLELAYERPALLTAQLPQGMRAIWTEEACLEVLAPTGNGSEGVVWATDCPDDIAEPGGVAGLALPGAEWCAGIMRSALLGVGEMHAREAISRPKRQSASADLAASIREALSAVPRETKADIEMRLNEKQLSMAQRVAAGAHVFRQRGALDD